MAGLPIGFTSKIGRAHEHLEALRVSIAAFTAADGEAYAVVKEANHKTGKFVFRIRVKKEAPVAQWALIIGDCLHNARTALDHMFFWMVLRQHGNLLAVKNPHKLGFPLFKTEAGFLSKKTQIQQWIGDDALAVVERLQPFKSAKGWNYNLLRFLHDFDISDKHRLLLPAVQVLQSSQILVKTSGGKTVNWTGSASLMGLEDNAVIAELTADAPKLVVSVDVRPSFDVIFEGQPGPMKVVPTLERCIKAVGGVGNEVVRHLL